MAWLTYLLTGGFLKGYRTLVLGITAIAVALGNYLVGDTSFVDFIQTLPVLLTGLGLFAAAAHDKA